LGLPKIEQYGNRREHPVKKFWMQKSHLIPF
jgi:hypothetical protein